MPAGDNWVDLAWSPDGSRLAVVTSLSSGLATLAVVDVRTKARTEVLSGDFRYLIELESPWSPDGRWIAAAASGGDLVVAAVDGSSRLTIPLAGGAATSATWSPADDVIAVGDAAGLVTVRADGTELVERPIASVGGAWAFDWSPDGTRLVVAAVDATERVSVSTLELGREAEPESLGVVSGTRKTGPTQNDTRSICLKWDAPPARD